MTERAQRAFPTQLLVDMVTDPRDPAYEAAALRRGGRPSRHWYDQPAVALGCLVAGFLLAVAYVHTNRGAPEAATVHNDLVARVRAAEGQAGELAATAQRMSAQLATLRDNAVGASLAGQLDREHLLAGNTAATGPGLTVSLSEPPPATASAQPGRGGSVPIGDGHILTDRDVRSVVNELWADGAEAIAVNGIRLTPVSAIRFAGQAVLVDFEPIASPYVISAIGNADALATRFAAGDVAGRYQTLSSAKGIGFSFQDETRIELPPSAGSTLRYAHAGGSR